MILVGIFVELINVTMWMSQQGNQHWSFVIGHFSSFVYLLMLLWTNNYKETKLIFFGFTLHYLVFSITDITTFCLYFDPKNANYTEYHKRLLLTQCVKFLVYCQLVVPSFKFRVSFPMACTVFGISHFAAEYVSNKPPPVYQALAKYLLVVLW